MASAAVFSSLRRRRTPSLEALLAPVDISDVNLLVTLAGLSSQLISTFQLNIRAVSFQLKNSRNLVRKIEVFAVLLECLVDVSSGMSPRLSSTAALCFKELYLVLYRSKILLDYCLQSSKMWLLLQNHSISGHFQDLNQEISTLLDVFPLDELNLPDDVVEQLELLKKQKSNLFIDRTDEQYRMKLYSFLNQFECGYIPDQLELHTLFVENLGIRDTRSCRMEIDFLEEQIANYDGDMEPTVSVLYGFVALTRYCRFLLFGFEEDELETRVRKHKKLKRGLLAREIAETFITVPKDFCCPISLDLMRDPVIISTGQTYDRSSIARWMEEGHCTCPKTGQMLVHTNLVPNRALRSLIMHWCSANGYPYDPPEHSDSLLDCITGSSPTKATVEANRATVGILIHQLASGTEYAKTIAAREIRLLAKNGKENRAYIAEAGGIPYLKKLLLSPNAVAQENSVTAMLNLSIYDKNKSRIMDEEGCLESIVGVLRVGYTTEARENAAATLFSLSAVHDYKKRIAVEDGAVEALAGMLREGTPRGKKDAVTALFNLSTHTDNCVRMIESGAVTALVGALGCEGVAEEAAGALALIVRQPTGAAAVGNEEMAVAGLIGMMRCGTPRGKENAVAALLELCRSGGAAIVEQVLKAPALAGLLQSLLFTGTKRARRKAASLARVFHRCEQASIHYGGLGVGYAFAAGNSTTSRDMSFTSDYSMPVPVSVPVL
ncbi:OLC1v1022017C1 [Oldenlandia corymbosa var. corymbosa]|uniref:RING-type E3 ubiquitin transferase n=1 Tax=Oldenlandia corymbosa var. corymbosa TaxID=529605 RepID=A0AAV1BZB5_OLDCO|nr:OLC1v1022017C1 [Oldenlandia corymbosa var. corymbosa]